MKHRDKEAATHVTFCTIKRPLRSLLDLHGEPLPKEPNPVGLAMRIAPLFAFLPVPVLFDIQGEDLLIRYPEEPESTKARAAKLARRAAQRADAGDYAGAASLWHRALQRQPSFHTARRGLAHAYVELGGTEKATPILLQVLYCNPEDIWALRALADAVRTSWPSATLSTQAGSRTRPRGVATSTRHIRHIPTGASRGW